MEADEVYSQLNEKISDLTSKDSEFQGTIDYLQSSITEAKNSIDSMKTDLDFVKSYAQNRQADSDAADLKSRYQDIINANLKLAADAEAAKKDADKNAGLITKLGGQMDDITKTVTSTDMIKSMISTAADKTKKEVTDIWDNSKKEINDYVGNQIASKIKETKEEVWSGVKEFFGQEEQAKPTYVKESDLEDKVKVIISSVQSDHASEFEEKVRAIIAAVAEEKKG